MAALVLIGGLIYAELGTRLPETGGEYIYISRCLGPFAGFMFGWAQLFIIRTSPAAGLAIVVADYVGHFTELSPTAKTTVALSIIAALGVFNYVGIEWASLFQKITTSTKVVGLVLFAAGGVVLFGGVANQLGTSAATTTGVGTIGNVVAALMLIVFTYVGWDRLFFRWLDFVHPTFRTPSRSILVHCIWAAIILVGRGSFESIAAGMVFAILIFYTLTALALFKLRRNETGDEDVYRMPWYPTLPVIYLIGVVGLLVVRAIFEWEKSIVDFAFVATGIPVSVFWLWKRRDKDATDV